MNSGILAVAGDLLEDIVVWGVSDHLSVATDNPGKIFRSRGGSAANVAAKAAAFTRVRFIGRVGDDAAGTWLCESLAAVGVDVRVQRGGVTGTVVVLVTANGERTMIPDRAASAELQPIDAGVLDGVTWLHMPLYGFETGSSASSLVDLGMRARAQGVPISVDLSSVSLLQSLGGRTRSLMETLRPQLIFANADEAAFADIRHDAGADSDATYVIKNGSGPVEIIDRHGSITAPVEPIETVYDSTGAGDSFAAGFLAAKLAGASPRECAVAGSNAAAQVLSRPGA